MPILRTKDDLWSHTLLMKKDELGQAEPEVARKGETRRKQRIALYFRQGDREPTVVVSARIAGISLGRTEVRRYDTWGGHWDYVETFEPYRLVEATVNQGGVVERVPGVLVFDYSDKSLGPDWLAVILRRH